eukprot:TRINITY_DN14465_c0_g1_i3.p1 TRINITY_DN14465_c0_g1~~TRINITY_DN14465_c0_g1_i3.p1  ORF type:complete len:317 (-),score=116.06 TRINITY_DN14465_c0_g1_i3:382-1287(-)
MGSITQPRTKMTSSPELLSLSHQAPDTHNQLVRQVVASWRDKEADMVLLSREGEKVFMQRIFLSFFSPQVRAICSEIPAGEPLTMSVPASKTSLDTLLTVLSTGTVITSSRDDLLDVTETAACLGIELKDIQIGVKNSESLGGGKKKEEHVEKKVSKRGRKKKSENAKNDPIIAVVDNNTQESQQTVSNGDASGPVVDIHLINEKEESEQCNTENEEVNELDDTKTKIKEHADKKASKRGRKKKSETEKKDYKKRRGQESQQAPSDTTAVEDVPDTKEGSNLIGKEQDLISCRRNWRNCSS